MAAIVISHDFVELGADVLDSGHLEQKTRELPYPGRQSASRRERFGLLLKEIFEMMRDHRRARAGGDDDVLRAGENREEMPCNLPRLVPESAVEGRLPAAGLRFGKIDVVA